MSGSRFEDLPGALDYLRRRREMLARHDRERGELGERQFQESLRMTREFRQSLGLDDPSDHCPDAENREDENR